MAIKIFVTGGTFDKEYDELTGKLFFKDTHLNEILSRGRSQLKVKIETLMMIDSLEMNETHRELILKKCKENVEENIVITHGTDTMEVTAKILGEANLAKTIVLTGAMIPYQFGSSDGFFNMGCALSLVQTLPAGVYVAMNGKYFNWNNVRKNKLDGIFETRV